MKFEEMADKSVAELLEFYNANVPEEDQKKRFKNRNEAEELVSEIIAARSSVGEKISASTAASWEDPEVRAARSQRHYVVVDGVEYPSFKSAWNDLGLPPGRHGPHRKALFAAKGKKMEIEGMKWEAFPVEKKEAA